VSRARREFDCFGGTVVITLVGPAAMEPERAASAAEANLLDAHRRLSRFLPDSELSRLNRDRRRRVPAGPLLLRLAAAARAAGELTDGLVDATLLAEIETAGYRDPMPARGAAARHEDGAPTAYGADETTPTGPAKPSPARAWAEIAVDWDAGVVARPAGVAIDSGGIAKGLLADEVGSTLERFPAYAVDCCGDIRIGGSAGAPRPVRVQSPFAGGEPIQTLEIARGGVATSGVTRRSWQGTEGAPAHHLLDPATGEPAFTGVVQATALAPSAFLADIHAKWALLSGPALAPARLPFGGILVLADGRVETVAPPAPAPAAAA
jgi:FAD:protein FMN transferase